MRGWLSVLVLVGAVGCATGRGEVKVERGDGDASAYYPLAVGNSWTYAANLLGETSRRTVKIVAEKDGYFVDNMGGQLTVDAFGIRDHKRYLLRPPFEAERSWQNVVSVSSIETYKILDPSFSCQVPAGRFERCVRVEARNRVDQNTTLVNELTFAPHVGIVRIETVALNKGERIPQAKLELTSYTVQPQGGQKAAR